MVEFEGYERRINQINKILAENDLKDLEEEGIIQKNDRRKIKLLYK